MTSLAGFSGVGVKLHTSYATVGEQLIAEYAVAAQPSSLATLWVVKAALALKVREEVVAELV